MGGRGEERGSAHPSMAADEILGVKPGDGCAHTGRSVGTELQGGSLRLKQ